MKRITSLLLIAVMLLYGFSGIVYAEKAAIDLTEAMGLLSAIEILPEEIDASQSVTRADFAVYVARMFKVNDFTENNDRYYKDVPMDHYALTAINYLTEMNIVSGNGADYFYPDDGVNLAQACKILVEAIGYGEFANTLGGYPSGYIRAAQRFEMIDANVDMEKQLTVGETAELLTHTITADFGELLPVQYNDVAAHTEGTLLEIYHNSYVVEGVVEATNGMAVYEDNILDSDRIFVNGKTMKNPMPTKTATLLGEYVRAYYRCEKEGDLGELIYIYAVPERTNSLTISIENYRDISGTTVYYLDEGTSDEKQISLERAYFVVYNGSPYTSGNNENAFQNLGNGRITFKDTNDNGGYDVVIIESSKDFYVSGKDVKDLELYDLYLSDSQDSKLSLKDYEVVEIYNADLNPAEFTEISEKSILSVFKTSDKRVLRLDICNKTITGIVETMKTENGKTKITVGGAAYTVSDNAIIKSNATLSVGETLTFYLNSFNQIAYFESSLSPKMTAGYLVDIGKRNEVFQSRLMLKLCDRSGAVREFICAEELTIDTVNYTDADLAEKAIPNYNALNGGVSPQIIAYELNNDNEIEVIDTLALNGTETQDNSLTKTIAFGDVVVYGSGRLGLTSVIQPERTIQFIVPDDAKAKDSEDKHFTVGSVTLVDTGYYSRIEGYKYRGDNVYEDVIVRKDVSTTTLTRSNTIMLVEEVSGILTEEGRRAISLSGLIQGAPVSYILDDDCVVTDFDATKTYTVADISEGDTIRVSSAGGIVGSIQMIYDYSKGGLPDWVKEGKPNWFTTNTENYYWTEIQISFGYVEKRNQDIIEISYKNDGSKDEIYQQLGSVMVYDSESVHDRVYIGNISDIRDNETHGVGKGSRVIIQTDQGRDKGIIIYR